jgi:hypothetical protein
MVNQLYGFRDVGLTILKVDLPGRQDCLHVKLCSCESIGLG